MSQTKGQKLLVKQDDAGHDLFFPRFAFLMRTTS